MTTSSPRDRRWLLISTLIGLLLVILLAGGVVAIRARQMPIMTDAGFVAAQEKWAANGPADYEITIEVQGRQPATYHVVVQNHTPLSASRNGHPLKQPRIFGTWSVPGMFGTMQSDVDNRQRHGNLILGAVFDPDYGYPDQYQRIERQTGAHDAMRWKVVQFSPGSQWQISPADSQ